MEMYIVPDFQGMKIITLYSPFD